MQFCNVSGCQNILLCIVHDATPGLWQGLARSSRGSWCRLDRQKYWRGCSWAGQLARGPKLLRRGGSYSPPSEGRGKGGGAAALQAMQAESWAGGMSVKGSGGQPASLAPVLAESSLICSLLVLQAARTVSKGSGFFPLIHKNLALWSVTKKSTSGRLINTLVRNRASCTSRTRAAFTARCVFCTHLFTGLTRRTHRYFVLQVVASA